jgi:hypothetical protein
MNRYQAVRRYVRFIMTFTAGLWLLTGVAMAQTAGGNVVGKLADASGSPIPGVTVTLSGIGAQDTQNIGSNFYFTALIGDIKNGYTLNPIGGRSVAVCAFCRERL